MERTLFASSDAPGTEDIEQGDDLKTALNLLTYFLVLVESLSETADVRKAGQWLKDQLEQLRKAEGLNPKDLRALQDYYADVMRSHMVKEGMTLEFATPPE